jgi:hypothetical protein
MAADPRTGALISLLLALNAVHKAVDPAAAGLSQPEMNTRAKRIAEGDWASGAVRRAIDSMHPAVIAATSSAVIPGGGSRRPLARHCQRADLPPGGRQDRRSRPLAKPVHIEIEPVRHLLRVASEWHPP